jgi:hypothetical protein
MIIAEPIAVGSYNLTGIANIREIVGSINQSIILMQNGRDEQIAEILKDIGGAIITSPRMDEEARQTAMEILRTLAWEASLPSAERQLGIVKAELAYMPVLLKTNPDVLSYFEARLGDLRKFFKISA